MNLHTPVLQLPIAFSPPLPKICPIVRATAQVKPPVLLTAALIHEVRNPLTNINLAVEMLSSLVIGEEEKSYLDIILRSSNRINTLVTDLVIQQHSNVEKVEEYSLHHLLDEVKCSDLESERADMLIERGLYIQLAESADLRRGVLLILARVMDPVSKTTTSGSLSNFLDGTMCSPYKEAKSSVQKVNLILYIAEQILDNGVEGGYTEANQTW